MDSAKGILRGTNRIPSPLQESQLRPCANDEVPDRVVLDAGNQRGNAAGGAAGIQSGT